eukprot:CAMPEP_0206517076 /NCGR_PEP_ID=MMETSP0324_2-20121206/63749_1 /ASSEMBLY_ACC=CAM_ASM_000836 /TAXON_ID=2866 /ORGANISM="Crypthecodinium cohnii, Strain Seligo" /LENGTH=82 /DNA_ID=CAMNT_0054010135 /DNA_START=69 /DNA_END=313 /DNA_ORIENTATION=-
MALFQVSGPTSFLRSDDATSEKEWCSPNSNFSSLGLSLEGVGGLRSAIEGVEALLATVVEAAEAVEGIVAAGAFGGSEERTA